MSVLELVSLTETSDQDEDEEGNRPAIDVVVADPFPLEENMFGITTSTIVRDLSFMTTVRQGRKTRFSRIAVTVLLLIICVWTQIFLLLKIKTFVTARAVHDARVAYDAFEAHMYANNTYLSSNGYKRGIDGYFDQDLFHSFNAEHKSTACRIPLSQPHFLLVVITIWTLTCVNEYKELLHSFNNIVINLPHVASMDCAVMKQEEDEKSMEIVGLTWPVKLFVACLLFLRFVICSVLLWMGCRWLTATTDFNDLILNSVALVFVLDLKDFLYMILVPERNKRDLQNTKVHPLFKVETPTPMFFLGSFVWFIVAVIWAFAYVCFFQHVLPDYGWDIRQACSEWIDQRYSLTNTFW